MDHGLSNVSRLQDDSSWISVVKSTAPPSHGQGPTPQINHEKQKHACRYLQVLHSSSNRSPNCSSCSCSAEPLTKEQRHITRLLPIMDDVDDIRDVSEPFPDLFVRDAVGLDLMHVDVEDRADALVIENSQLLLHFLCHCPGIAAPEGGVDRDCDEDPALCAELDVGTAEEGPENTNLCGRFFNPRRDFKLVSEVV